MREIGAFEAKTRLSELLAAAEAGESITITRRGAPVARLVPAAEREDHSAALTRIAALRRRLGDRLEDGRATLTRDEILSARDQGRR